MKLVDKFREVAGFEGDSYTSEDDVDAAANRVQKEAYVCKRMKLTRTQLIELCYCTGVDTLYDELRRKGGRR